MVDIIKPDKAAILKCLSKTDEDLQEGVTIIKEWLKFQPHLPQFTDKQIETAIIKKRFSLEKAKALLDTSASMKNFVTELIDKDPLTDPDILASNKTMQLAIMDGYTDDFSRVAVCSFTPAMASAGLSEVTGGQKRTQLAMDLFDNFDFTLGTVIVYDFRNLPLSITRSLDFVMWKKFIYATTKRYPVKEIHFVFKAELFQVLLLFLKPILKEKIYKRIHVHKTVESLYEFVPKRLLPEELGGSQASFETLHNQWVAVLEKQRDMFIANRNWKSDESKRPKDNVNNDLQSMHGLDGSFRRLNVD